MEEAEAIAEEDEDVDAEEEESVMVLHPALAEVTDFEASLVGFEDLSKAPDVSTAGTAFKDKLSVLFLF